MLPDINIRDTFCCGAIMSGIRVSLCEPKAICKWKREKLSGWLATMKGEGASGKLSERKERWWILAGKACSFSLWLQNKTNNVAAGKSESLVPYIS
jgi:hypothetical protein